MCTDTSRTCCPSGTEIASTRAPYALVFADDRQVLEYQLVQHETRRFELKLMTADEQAFSASRDRAVPGLLSLLGPDAVIDTSRHTDLGRPERERTGKFRLVASHYDSNE